MSGHTKRWMNLKKGWIDAMMCWEIAVQETDKPKQSLSLYCPPISMACILPPVPISSPHVTSLNTELRRDVQNWCLGVCRSQLLPYIGREGGKMERNKGGKREE